MIRWDRVFAVMVTLGLWAVIVLTARALCA